MHTCLLVQATPRRVVDGRTHAHPRPKHNTCSCNNTGVLVASLEQNGFAVFVPLVQQSSFVVPVLAAFVYRTVPMR